MPSVKLAGAFQEGDRGGIDSLAYQLLHSGHLQAKFLSKVPKIKAQGSRGRTNLMLGLNPPEETIRSDPAR